MVDSQTDERIWTIGFAVVLNRYHVRLIILNRLKLYSMMKRAWK